jgi:uncharacterized membrane protein
MRRRLTVWARSAFVAPRIYPVLFVLLALPLGIVLTALVPLGQVPDEQAHAMRAESLLYGQLIGHREPVLTDNGSVWPRSGVTTDISIADAAEADLHGSAAKVTEASRRAARATQWRDSPAFADLGPIAGYLPVFYIPSAVVIGAVRAVGFGPYNAAIAARLANLSLYIVLGAAALLIARRGRALILAVLLLPISLFLAASLSQDGLMIAASCLATALATWAWELPPSRTPRLLSAAVIACITVTKPPYLPIAALLLLPLSGADGAWVRMASLLRRFGLVMLIAVATVVWLAWGAREVTTPFWHPPNRGGFQEPGPLWPGPRPAKILEVDQAAQTKVLLNQPSLLLTLPARTLDGDVLRWREMIGVLGWLKLVLPADFYRVWIIALAVACLADLNARNDAPRGRRWLDPIVLVAACLVTVEAIYLSQYVAWTPVGAERIEGTQGRYFVPLIPLVAVALPPFALSSGAMTRGARTTGTMTRGAGLLALAVAGAISIFVIPAMVVGFYYLGP